MFSWFAPFSARHEQTPVPALGVTVHARIWDQAAQAKDDLPMVLVAGLGVSSAYWVRLGRRLAGRFCVFAPDLPGFGRTRPARDVPWPGGPSGHEQAEHLRQWLDARGTSRVILCGHSNGCQTVVEFATRHPRRVARMILIAPTYERGKRTLLQQIPRLLMDSIFETPSLLLLLLQQYADVGILRVLQQAVRTLGYPIEQRVGSIDVPVLVIRGQYDTVVGQEWTNYLTAQIPQSLLMVVENSGHGVHYSSPTLIAELISDFVTNKLAVPDLPISASFKFGIEDPRHDPLGPPQPISPGMYRSLNAGVDIATLLIAASMRPKTKTNVLLKMSAATALSKQVLTHSGKLSPFRLPIISQTLIDILWGTGLVAASLTYLGREKRRSRGIVMTIGLLKAVLAILTSKRTGPVRIVRANPDITGRRHTV